MAHWMDAGPLAEIAPQSARVVATPLGPVAIFRTLDDHLFAVADRCPHRQGPLSEGIVHGHQVTCPLHNWVIDLATGTALAPDRGGTVCFAVRRADGRVWLQQGEG